MDDFDINKALDADYPESYRFEEEGQKLVGIFRRVDTGQTEYGETRILVLEVEGKEVGVWLFHEALTSQLKKAKPKVGQQVGLKYLGKKQGKGRYSYHNYRVVTEPQEGASFDWDALGDDEDFTQDSGWQSFDQDDGGWGQASPPTETTQPTDSSNWSSSAPEPEPPSENGADLEVERGRYIYFNQRKSSQEIYQTAKKVWAQRGAPPPESREELQTADADTLRALNDALESGVF